MPVDDYIQQQLENTQDRQSFRTTARGLRELFRVLGFIDDSGDGLSVTDLGRRAAAFAGLEMNEEQIGFWRRAIRNMSHEGDDGEASHPYEVLLRLIARKPGIAKPRCALALEARNDSAAELERIVAMADLPEGEIRRRLGVSESNWDNAVKVLPKFAEQLGDVVQTGPRGDYRYHIADAPGRADAGSPPQANARQRPFAPRPPRTSRSVTPNTIGQAGTTESFDEAAVRPPADPIATAKARLDRLRRHNLIVKKLAARLAAVPAQLFEDPFDILAIVERIGIMFEVKTLDGTVEDERERVREALSQLLYYPAFLMNPGVREDALCRIACFEKRISDAHINWLNNTNIAVIWLDEVGFAGDALAHKFLGRFLKEFS
ncbi:MAG: hypothetical protein ACYDCD_13540 [Candidatus Acidiferrales bacterium]